MLIPNDFKILKEEKKIYPPIPRNIYQVELLSVELVDAKGKYAKAGDKNFSFQFTLLSGKDKGEDLRGRNVWNNFVPTSLYIGKAGKNALYQIVEAFLGKDLSPAEEAAGLSGALLNSFIGQQIKVFIDHNISNGKIYNNIISYMPIETPFNSLTAEERDKARVKIKNKPEFMPADEPPMPENFLNSENKPALTPEQESEIL